MASDNIYVQYVGFQSIGPRVHLLCVRSSERELASSFLTVAKESVRLALGALAGCTWGRGPIDFLAKVESK
jgi:hypothetical protein